MPQRILVVDDDRQIVRLLKAYLEQSGYQVLTAYDGESALHQLRHERPDLVILDLMLPDRDGWEVTRITRSGDAELAHTPIIMLTARAEDTDRIVGLELGADDYVVKPFNPREVVARVRAVLRRAEMMAAASQGPRLLRRVDLEMDVARHTVTRQGQPLELTPTEFDILRAFMEHPGRAFSRQELIASGPGDDYEGLERTVDSHIKNLRRKVEPDPGRPTRIQTVYGVGYRLVEDA
jgi:two-component system alkaline phosphatase synthesis response regulator PhoP